MNRMQGKTVLITGGARGQGEAESRLFAAEGAKVIIADVLVDQGVELARSIGGNARFERLDVSSEREWEQLVSGIMDREGGLHVLINNAGILRQTPLLKTSRDEFMEVVGVNQTGCFLGMKVAGAAMVKSGGGSIVNISSVGGLWGVPQAVSYTASKFAIRGMTKVAAMELGRHGIRVNSIHPGAIDTEMSRGGDTFSDVDLDKACGKQPLPRAGRPDEVARLALFLACDESSYCTGSEFTIDGGMMAGDTFQ